MCQVTLRRPRKDPWTHPPRDTEARLERKRSQLLERWKFRRPGAAAATARALRTAALTNPHYLSLLLRLRLLLLLLPLLLSATAAITTTNSTPTPDPTRTPPAAATAIYAYCIILHPTAITYYIRTYVLQVIYSCYDLCYPLLSVLVLLLVDAQSLGHCFVFLWLAATCHDMPMFRAHPRDPAGASSVQRVVQA